MSDDTAANPLLAQMREGETLLWTGRPNPECYFAQRGKEVAYVFTGGACSVWLLSLFSFALNGFSRSTAPLFLLGLFSLFAMRLLQGSRIAPRWWYAATDQRILSDRPTEDAEMIWQVPLALILNMRLKDHTQNVATIMFNSSFLQRKECGSFECVDDAEFVYNLIEDARRLARTA